MRGTKPNTPIPQVPYQHHFSFPLSTLTLPQPIPKYMVHSKINPGSKRRREKERERERERKREKRVTNFGCGTLKLG